MSTNGWKIIPKDSWKEVVAGYADRINRIRKLDPWNIELSEKPTNTVTEECVFAFTDEPLAKQIIKRLGFYGARTYFVALQVSQKIADLWESGQFIVVPLNTRFVFECWGGVHYGVLILQRLTKGGDAGKEYERTERLTFGTRTEIHLPWGETSSDLKSIHIMDFVRGLKDLEPNAEDIYNFLSESSHPSFTENAYFQMAGPPISNWDNKGFEKVAKPLLERCFDILEKSIDGIIKDAFQLSFASRLLSDEMHGEGGIEP